MPNLAVITTNSGKMTPLVDVRSDLEKYSGGTRISDNMIPLIYGPSTRRPGTRYRVNAEDNDVKSRMVPFIFSATVAYQVEFSDKIINVYFKNADDGTFTAIDTGIVTPYLEYLECVSKSP